MVRDASMKMTSEKDNEYVFSDPPVESLTHDAVNMNNPPLVSFVIPCFNDEDVIGKCLRSLRSQNYPDIEIIVVDNGSSDSSLEIADQYADTILSVEGRLGEVRSTGFSEANGEIIGSFDSDNYLIHDDWLRNSLRYFNYDEDVANVWPKNIAPPDSSVFSKMYWDLWEEIIEDRVDNARGALGGGTSLFTKSAINEVGGIDSDVHWGEDFNLATKIKNAGYKVVYIRDPIYHDTDMGESLHQFVRKQFLGATAFVEDGFNSTGMSLSEVFYEQFYLGFRAMFRNLIFERKAYWLYFPLFLLTRCLAYGLVLLKNKFLQAVN